MKLVTPVLFITLLAASLNAQPCPAGCPTADDIDVQAQLDAAALAGGGIVQLEPRVYSFCDPFIVGSNTHLRGSGRGATIMRGSASTAGKVVAGMELYASIATVGSNNVTISDLTVDHFTCNRNANGIVFKPAQSPDYVRATNAVVENVEVIGAPGFHSYMIWNWRGQGIKILNNWVDGRSFSGTSPQEGIESYGGTDVLISGNTVKNVGYACLNVGSAGVEDSTTTSIRMVDNDLSNCTIGVNLGTAWIAGEDPQNQQHTIVSGNTIVGMRRVGIDVSVRPGTLQSELTISNNIIRDITDPQAIGIWMRSSGSPIEPTTVMNNKITGNTIENIRGANAHGIRLSQYHNVTISDNTISGIDHGGIFTLYASRFEVINNRFDRAGHAPVQINGTAASGVTQFVVDNNQLRDWPGMSSGVLVLGAKFGTVRNNVLSRADTVLVTPVTVTSGSCGVSVNGNVAWYHPTWASPTVPACP